MWQLVQPDDGIPGSALLGVAGGAEATGAVPLGRS